MFCSNCGKSLKSDAQICPFCGMTVGESRFDSSRGYTGAQTRIKPGQAVRVNSSYVNHYSRDDTVESSSSGRLPSDEDSAYRAVKGAGITGYGEDDDREPLFDSQKKQEFPPEEEEEQPDEEVQAPKKGKKPSLFSFFSGNQRSENEDVDEADEPPVKDTPIDEITDEERLSLLHEDVEFAPPAGISDDIHAFMAGRLQAIDEAEDDIPAIKLKKRSKPSRDEDFESDFDELPEEDTNADTDDFEDESKPKKRKKAKARKAKQSKSKQKKSKPAAASLSEESEDEPLYGDDAEYTDETLLDDLRREKRLKYLRYVLVALIAVLLALGAVALLGNLRSSMNSAPVDEVSYDLWNEGVARMEQRVGQAYRRSMLASYNPSDMTTYVSLREKMTADLEELDSLMPANPQRNDRRFIDALKAIQESINNCLANDALAMSDNTQTATQKESQSDARWSQVRMTVEALKASTNTGQLDAIIKQERVELILEATPTPGPGATPTPVPYVSLQKGSTGENVIRLQTRLSDLGYLSGKIDGIYGNGTKTAVQKFQQKAGLKADGIAGVDTQTLLFSDDAPYAK
ncbi:MAG: peptidoglycan-binding protein [Clostridiales bacterium]|nr:peptidoglycan-binding protein [Clostridiales bacterium]